MLSYRPCGHRSCDIIHRVRHRSHDNCDILPRVYNTKSYQTRAVGRLSGLTADATHDTRPDCRTHPTTRGARTGYGPEISARLRFPPLPGVVLCTGLGGRAPAGTEEAHSVNCPRSQSNSVAFFTGTTQQGRMQHCATSQQTQRRRHRAPLERTTTSGRGGPVGCVRYSGRYRWSQLSMSNLAACECRASLLFLSLILPNSTFADLRVQQASRPDYIPRAVSDPCRPAHRAHTDYSYSYRGGVLSNTD